MAKLLLKFNDQVLKEIPLAPQQQLRIGRKKSNDAVIDNAAVSAEHARIFQEEGTYYIEDMASTNGTFLNEKRVQKEQLYDGDRVRVGKHLLVYQDETRNARPAPPSSPKGFDSEKTMIMDTQRQRELLKGKQTPAPPRASDKVGTFRVISGKTDRPEYELSGRLILIGSEKNAEVKLTGWFAPKVAALISRRQDGYSVSKSEAAKSILVNGVPIEGRCELEDGDLLEVAGVIMCFYLKGLAR